MKTKTSEEVCENCGHGEHTNYYGCKVLGCPCMRFKPKKTEERK